MLHQYTYLDFVHHLLHLQHRKQDFLLLNYLYLVHLDQLERDLHLIHYHLYHHRHHYHFLKHYHHLNLVVDLLMECFLILRDDK